MFKYKLFSMQKYYLTTVLRYVLFFTILFFPASAVLAQNDTLLQKGIDLYDKGEYEKSIVVLQQRLTIAISDNDKKVQKTIYNSLGNNYTSIGKTLDALKAYQDAISIAEELKDRRSVARTTKNIGGLYSDTKDFARAMQKYDEAEKIALEVRDTSTIADCANNRGVVYEQEKKYNEALEQYTKAIVLYTALKQDDRICRLYNNLGIVYKFLKNYDKSIECYQKSLELSKKTGSKFMVAANQINIGNVYEMKGDYKTAIELNEQGLQTGKEINAQELVMEAIGNLAEDHAKAGDYKRGFELFKEFAAVKDSFINVDRSRQTADLQTKYETEKKEKTIIALEKNRYQMLAVIGILTLLIVIAYLLYSRQQVKQKQAREKAVLAAEYNERMRIAKDVHDDLGSGLSKISLMAGIAQAKAQPGAAQNNDVTQIAGVAKELIDNMRELIWVLNPENTTLDQLVARLREYCADYVENLPVEMELDFPSEVSPMRITREVQRNIFLTVKEAINNGIKHAHANVIAVTLKLDHDAVNITVADNGKGFDISTVKGGGNGLRNMQQRIENVGGVFAIESAAGGTSINISIPMNKVADAKIQL